MNAFRQLLKSSGAHPPIGTWIGSASPLVAEAIGCCGFDWALVDMEHAPLDVSGLVHVLQALAGTKTLPVVRVPWNDAVTVKRVLDAGATTVMVPFVQNADEAQRAVAATRYPPEGIRGMAGVSRATRFGTTPHYFRSANQNIGVIVQIETPQAVEQVDAIAAVPGVDALFVGPADLSAALGHIGELNHPAVVGMMSTAVQRCKALGMPVGTLGAHAEAVAQYRAIGFDFVAVSSDIGFMMRAAQAAIASLRTRDTEHVHSLSSGTQPSTA
ncbi:MAG TPA: aldolase/citrate lyase family protein [Albitalea sp.]|jgi:2-dehydro-3-deoxyglucarate aldolase|nr:aldolase/citrate lyase family protein [Albitalea sp.]